MVLIVELQIRFVKKPPRRVDILNQMKPHQPVTTLLFVSATNTKGACIIICTLESLSHYLILSLVRWLFRSRSETPRTSHIGPSAILICKKHFWPTTFAVGHRPWRCSCLKLRREVPISLFLYYLFDPLAHNEYPSPTVLFRPREHGTVPALSPNQHCVFDQFSALQKDAQTIATCCCFRGIVSMVPIQT